MVRVVPCCVCGRRWDARSADVLYRSADRTWWCKDGPSCFSRYAMTQIVAACGSKR